MMKMSLAADVMVEAMTAADIRPLFPLMQATEPELQLNAWLSHARRMARAAPGSKRGILVARRAGQAWPCGAAHYRLERSPRFGSLLTAEHVVALDLLYPHAVLAALFGALEVHAGLFGCNAIRSILRDSRPDLLEKLVVAGHQRDGMTFMKAVQRA